MQTFASILIALAAAIVKVLLQQRQAAGDAHEVGRLSAVQKGLLDAKAALEWKVEAVADPRGAATLRLRDGAGRIVVPGDDTESDHLP